MSEHKTPPTTDQTPEPNKPAVAKAEAKVEPTKEAAKPAKGADGKPATKGGKPGAHEPPAGHEPSGQADKGGSALGGTLAFLALLVALGAGGVSYYLWQQLQQVRSQVQQADAGIGQRLNNLETSSANQSSALQDTEDKLRDEFTNKYQDLDKSEQALRQQLQETVFQLKSELGSEQKDWSVAEAEYLLRIANRRLQLERDVHTAEVALQLADERLTQHGDPAYLPVRQAIADEIQALHTEAGADPTSLSLQLSGVISEVGKLPLADDADKRRAELKAHQAETEAGQPAPANSWRDLPAALWNNLKELVTIRRGDQRAQPLLAPEQSYFLRQNLQLKLETARLALLRGNAAVYQRTMLEAADWIRSYYDAGNSATEQVLNEIATLGSADIHPTLPDISGSLRTLRKVTAKLGVNATTPRVTLHPAPAKTEKTPAKSAPAPAKEKAPAKPEPSAPQGPQS